MFMILYAALPVQILWQQYYFMKHKEALLAVSYSIKLLYIIRQLKHVVEQLR
jgi:hypothetical protein